MLHFGKILGVVLRSILSISWQVKIDINVYALLHHIDFQVQCFWVHTNEQKVNANTVKCVPNTLQITSLHVTKFGHEHLTPWPVQPTLCTAVHFSLQAASAALLYIYVRRVVDQGEGRTAILQSSLSDADTDARTPCGCWKWSTLCWQWRCA